MPMTRVMERHALQRSNLVGMVGSLLLLTIAAVLVAVALVVAGS
jgi:hypothetical protein